LEKQITSIKAVETKGKNTPKEIAISACEEISLKFALFLSQLKFDSNN